jgi:hypothetical protein
VVNSGSIILGGTSAATELRILAAGATLTGKGDVLVSNTVHDTILGLAAGDTLTNVDNHIIGAGQLGDGVMTLVNEAKGVILGNESTALVINTGASTITNAGLIENTGSGGVQVESALNNTGTLYAGNGALTLDGAVTGTGSARINAGVLNIGASFGQTVTFVAGATGELRLVDFKDFTGKVAGLSTAGANMIDLVGFNIVGTKATYSGTATSGVLTVSNGTQTATIHLLGNYLGHPFTVVSDGVGGVFIKDPAVLIQAMATVQAGAPAGSAGSTASGPSLTPLVHGPG